MRVRSVRTHEDQPIAELYGLGSASQRMLADAGIHRRADLERLGPMAAFIAVVDAGHRPTLNLLWALAGALRDVHWTKLPDDCRSTLLQEYDAWCERQAR